MNKNKVKLGVDIGMAISFLLALLTGLFKWQSLGRIFSGVYGFVSFRTISVIHDWSGIVLILFVLVHLILNWSWIKSWFRKNQNG